MLYLPTVSEFYLSIYEIAACAKERGLVLYGNGFWGEVTVRIFSLFSVYPICFCDDDNKKLGIKTISMKDGEDICTYEIPVMSLNQAVDMFPNAIYIATASNEGGEASARYAMNQRLKEKGVLSKYSGFHPVRYSFLLETGLPLPMKYKKCHEELFHASHFSKIVVMNHMGNSGSTYFNTLIDSHPNVISIVFLGGQTRLEQLYQKRLQYLEEEELIVEITSQMDAYLKPILSFDCFQKSSKIGEKFFLDAYGQPERRIYVDSKRFLYYLSIEIQGKGRISYNHMLRCIHAAYANAIGKRPVENKEYWLFYDMHTVGFQISSIRDLLEKDSFDEVIYLYLIRNPIQQLYSFLKRFVIHTDAQERYYMLKYEFPAYLKSGIGIMLEKNCGNETNCVKVIRFEDIKRNTKEVMETFCGYLSIPYDECLQQTTVNGIEVFFPSYSGQNGDVISGKCTSAIDKTEYGDVFSVFDEARLSLLYKNFCEKYGYLHGNEYDDFFGKSTLEEIFSTPFLFEETIDALLKKDREQYKYPYEKIAYKDYLRMCYRDIPQKRLDYFDIETFPKENKKNADI